MTAVEGPGPVQVTAERSTSPDAVPADGLAGVPLRRTPTQARSRDKVTRALRVAEDIVASAGPDAVTLTNVAGSAGLSTGALYQYLPDREAIIAALVARYHGRIEALMEQAIARTLEHGMTDPVGEILGHIADVYRDEGAVRSLRTSSAASAEMGRAHKRRMTDKVHRLLVASGLVGVEDEAVSRMVFVSADAVLHEAFAASGAGPDTEMLAELEQMLRVYTDRTGHRRA